MIRMDGSVELLANDVSDNAFFIAHERDIDSLLVILSVSKDGRQSSGGDTLLLSLFSSLLEAERELLFFLLSP